ncbi:MAG: hypothetical protein M3N47_04815, partial [Chloroflexota bacterium]|nr:hypothetical protein [Chloroflexota bacterium]
ALIVEVRLLPPGRTGATQGQVALLAVIALATMVVPLVVLIVDAAVADTYAAQYAFLAVAVIEVVVLVLQGYAIVNAWYSPAKPPADRSPPGSHGKKATGRQV